MTALVLDLAGKAVAFGVGAAFDSRFPTQNSLATKALRYAVTAIATAVFAKAGDMVSVKASDLYSKYTGKVQTEGTMLA